MKSFSYLNRTIALVTAIFFTWESAVGHAFPGITLLPKDSGKLESITTQNRDKNVILLLNAHTSSDAQRNIASLLEFFQVQGIDLIGLEGADEKIDGKMFRDYPAKGALKQAAWQMVQDGTFTGAEYFYITAEKLPNFFGLEDKDLYLRDRDAFIKTVTLKEDLKETIEKLDGAVGDLKQKIYSKTLRQFDQTSKLYESGDLRIYDYFERVFRAARDVKIPLPKYEAIYTLSKAISRERKLSEKALTQELEKLKQFIPADAWDDRIESLILSHQKVPEDELFENYKQIHSYLKAVIQRKEVSTKTFKHIQRYLSWLEAASQLESETVFSELELLINYIYEKNTKTEKEKELIELAKSFSIFKKMLSIQLTQKEWERELQAARIVLEMDNVIDLVASELKERAPQFEDVEVTRLHNAQKAAIDFYEVAEQRNEVFANHIVDAMEKAGKSTAVVVIGGFHEKGLKATIEAQGISTAVISPRINQALDDIPYFDRMMGKPTSIEIAIDKVLSVSGLSQILPISNMISMAAKKKIDLGLDALAQLHEVVAANLEMNLAEIPLTVNGREAVFSVTQSEGSQTIHVSNATVLPRQTKSAESSTDLPGVLRSIVRTVTAPFFRPELRTRSSAYSELRENNIVFDSHYFKKFSDAEEAHVSELDRARPEVFEGEHYRTNKPLVPKENANRVLNEESVIDLVFDERDGMRTIVVEDRDTLHYLASYLWNVFGHRVNDGFAFGLATGGTTEAPRKAMSLFELQRKVFGSLPVFDGNPIFEAGKFRSYTTLDDYYWDPKLYLEESFNFKNKQPTVFDIENRLNQLTLLTSAYRYEQLDMVLRPVYRELYGNAYDDGLIQNRFYSPPLLRRSVRETVHEYREGMRRFLKPGNHIAMHKHGLGTDAHDAFNEPEMTKERIQELEIYQYTARKKGMDLKKLLRIPATLTKPFNYGTKLLTHDNALPLTDETRIQNYKHVEGRALHKFFLRRMGAAKIPFLEYLINDLSGYTFDEINIMYPGYEFKDEAHYLKEFQYLLDHFHKTPEYGVTQGTGDIRQRSVSEDGVNKTFHLVSIFGDWKGPAFDASWLRAPTAFAPASYYSLLKRVIVMVARDATNDVAPEKLKANSFDFESQNPKKKYFTAKAIEKSYGKTVDGRRRDAKLKERLTLQRASERSELRAQLLSRSGLRTEPRSFYDEKARAFLKFSNETQGELPWPTEAITRMFRLSDMKFDIMKLSNSEKEKLWETAINYLLDLKKRNGKITLSVPAGGKASRMRKGVLPQVLVDAMHAQPEDYVNPNRFLREEWSVIKNKFGNNWHPFVQSLDPQITTSGKDDKLVAGNEKDHTILKRVVNEAKALLPAGQDDAGTYYSFLAYSLLNVKNANDELERMGLGRPFVAKVMANEEYYPQIMKHLARHRFYGLRVSALNQSGNKVSLRDGNKDTIVDIDHSDLESELILFNQPLIPRVVAPAALVRRRWAEDQKIPNRISTLNAKAEKLNEDDPLRREIIDEIKIVEKERVFENRDAFKYALAYAQKYEGTALHDLKTMTPGGHGWYHISQLLSDVGSRQEPALITTIRRKVEFDFMHNIDNMAMTNDDWMLILGHMIDQNLLQVLEASRKPATERGSGGGGFAWILEKGKKVFAQLEYSVIRASQGRDPHSKAIISSKFNKEAEVRKNQTEDKVPVNNATLWIQTPKVDGDLNLEGEDVYSALMGRKQLGVAIKEALQNDNYGPINRLAGLMQEKLGINLTLKPIKDPTKTDPGENDLVLSVVLETMAWDTQKGEGVRDRMDFVLVPSIKDADRSDHDPARIRFNPLKDLDAYSDLIGQPSRWAALQRVIHKADLFGSYFRKTANKTIAQRQELRVENELKTRVSDNAEPSLLSQVEDWLDLEAIARGESFRMGVSKKPFYVSRPFKIKVFEFTESGNENLSQLLKEKGVSDKDIEALGKPFLYVNETGKLIDSKIRIGKGTALLVHYPAAQDGMPTFLNFSQLSRVSSGDFSDSSQSWAFDGTMSFRILSPRTKRINLLAKAQLEKRKGGGLDLVLTSVRSELRSDGEESKDNASELRTTAENRVLHIQRSASDPIVALGKDQIGNRWTEIFVGSSDGVSSLRNFLGDEMVQEKTRYVDPRILQVKTPNNRVENLALAIVDPTDSHYKIIEFKKGFDFSAYKSLVRKAKPDHFPLFDTKRDVIALPAHVKSEQSDFQVQLASKDVIQFVNHVTTKVLTQFSKLSREADFEGRTALRAHGEAVSSLKAAVKNASQHFQVKLSDVTKTSLRQQAIDLEALAGTHLALAQILKLTALELTGMGAQNDQARDDSRVELIRSFFDASFSLLDQNIFESTSQLILADALAFSESDPSFLDFLNNVALQVEDLVLQARKELRDAVEIAPLSLRAPQRGEAISAPGLPRRAELSNSGAPRNDLITTTFGEVKVRRGRFDPNSRITVFGEDGEAPGRLDAISLEVVSPVQFSESFVEQILVRTRSLAQSPEKPTVYVPFDDDAVALLIEDAESDQSRTELRNLFALTQLGAQEVVILMDETFVRPFNQLLDQFKRVNQIKLPPGVGVKAAYFGNDTALVKGLSRVRTGVSYLMAPLAQANVLAPAFADSSTKLVVSDYLMNGLRKTSFGNSSAEQIDLTAALLLLRNEFRVGGGHGNILFGEQSIVQGINAILSRVLQSVRVFATAA